MYIGEIKTEREREREREINDDQSCYLERVVATRPMAVSHFVTGQSKSRGPRTPCLLQCGGNATASGYCCNVKFTFCKITCCEAVNCSNHLEKGYKL